MGRNALKIADFTAPVPAVAPDDFRAVMRELASGVALVTTARERERMGCAVTSFASLSLEPASLLVCLNGDSSTLRAIRDSGAFAINILGAGHEELARRFSSPKLRGPERFAAGEWGSLKTGSPTLAGALAVIDCRLERVVPHATHAILIGAAAAVAKGEPGPALLHWRSHFETLA